jgi:hypothetical protein
MLHLSADAEEDSGMDLPTKIGRVEKDEGEAIGAVGKRGLEPGFAVSAGDVINGRHLSAGDADLAFALAIEGFFFGFVLIVAREIFQEIGEGRDAKRSERFGAGGADFVEIVDCESQQVCGG